MNTTVVVIALIIAVVVIVVVFLLKDRLSELSVNGKEATMAVKTIDPEDEVKTTSPAITDEKPVGVVFKGNKLRGEGEYRMRDTEFSENDVDGNQKVELGYDEPSKDVTSDDRQ